MQYWIITMKLTTLKPLTLLAGSLLVGASLTSVYAEEPVSANVSLATDYVWRGVSQTSENPAISGGFDWTPTENFYVGTWASNVDFGSVENIEVDLYAGWATELSSGLGLDFGFIQYLFFDDANNADANEIYAGASYKDFSGKLSYDVDNKNTYIEAGYDYELASGLGLGFHIGNYDFDAGGDYTDYSIGLSGSFKGLDYGLAYTDTDIKNVDEADGRVVLSISRSF